MLDSCAQKIRNILRRELVLLWIFSILAGLALVALQNKDKLPLGKGDFVFFAILALLVALYKSRWIFFLFISFLPLENIILASGFLPMQLRPYQFLGGILAVAVGILFISKKQNFRILKPTWIDWLVFSLVPFSFLALLNSPNKSVSLKNNFVLLSFIVLYYIARNFLRTRTDFAKAAFFFLGSYIVVTAYGFYQVFAEKFGRKSFEVMFGRPNSTFTEPDWLGIFLCFALAVFLSLIFFFIHEKEKFIISKKYILLFLDLLIFSDITLIILTLSRSAWIGAAFVVFLYLFLNLPRIRKYSIEYFRIPGNSRIFFRETFFILLIIAASAACIMSGKLSEFDILDRARSTATSEQKITIACENSSDIPQAISSTDELENFNCRHINLEEINFYKSQGKIVTEIFRKDPNVMTRGVIYQKSWEILKAHPIFGVGFGTITQNLGTDQRGTGLNESNIFLQIWAGSGIIGLIAFIAVIGYLFIYAFRRVSPICSMNKIIGCPVACPAPISAKTNVLEKNKRRSRFNLFTLLSIKANQDWCGVKDDFEKTLSIFAVLGIMALIIPNLFNAGLFMGIFWLGLATAVNAKDIIRSDSL